MHQRQLNLSLLGLTVLLVIGSWFLVFPPNRAEGERGPAITQGLDLEGGLSVILTAEETSNTPVTGAVMQRAELIILNRVNGLGVKEATVQRQGNDSLLIQIPGASDPEQALETLGSTGQLEFVDVSSINDTSAIAAIAAMPNANESAPESARFPQLKPGTYQPFMTGEVVTDAGVSTNPNTAEIEVSVTMNAEGTRVWGDYTTANIGKQIAIVLDGRVQSAPAIREPILDGRTAISGSFTAAEAKRLQTVLETGALPVTLVASEARQVGPTLGQDSLRAGLIAVAFGLGLVALYVLVFYRGLGLLTVGALVIFASIFLGILALMSRMGIFALTLPGIAGIVLTIGLAADSSILILERFKEEIRLGKTVRSAANSGSKHGILTSVDADLVTLVSAAALYTLAIGPVKGFALTLMLGIMCDILMMVIYKRPALMLLAESAIVKAPALWGTPKEHAATPASSKKGGAVRG